MILSLQVHEYKLPQDIKQFRASLTSGKHARITFLLQGLIILPVPFCRLPVIAFCNSFRQEGKDWREEKNEEWLMKLIYRLYRLG